MNTEKNEVAAITGTTESGFRYTLAPDTLFNKNITKMIGGSKVVTAKASTSVQVLSNSEINNALGVTKRYGRGCYCV